jgi:hypothetical protein
MERIKLLAIRDLAVGVLPRAVRVTNERHPTPDDYHLALLGSATFTLADATASAKEIAAANLLQPVASTLTMSTGTNARAVVQHQLASEIGEALERLCELLGIANPWPELKFPKGNFEHSDSGEAPNVRADCGISSPVGSSSTAPDVKPLTPGTFLDTHDAAHHLNKKPQTLRSWASKGNGPIQPKRTSTGPLSWAADDIIATMKR